MKVLRVNRLRTSILSDSIKDIGKFKTVERLVNLNADRKRLWFDGDGDGIGCESKKQTSSSTSQSSSQQTDCDPSYPDFCIPPPPPDLDCKDISKKRFTVLQPDPHRFDGDKDGIGCES